MLASAHYTELARGKTPVEVVQMAIDERACGRSPNYKARRLLYHATSVMTTHGSDESKELFRLYEVLLANKRVAHGIPTSRLSTGDGVRRRRALKSRSRQRTGFADR